MRELSGILLSILRQDMPALPATPSCLTALYGEDVGVGLTVGEICALRKQSLPYFSVMPATYSTISIPRKFLGKSHSHSWEKGGTHRLGLGQEKLSSDRHGMSIGTQLGVPVGS